MHLWEWKKVQALLWKEPKLILGFVLDDAEPSRVKSKQIVWGRIVESKKKDSRIDKSEFGLGCSAHPNSATHQIDAFGYYTAFCRNLLRLRCHIGIESNFAGPQSRDFKYSSGLRNKSDECSGRSAAALRHPLILGGTRRARWPNYQKKSNKIASPVQLEVNFKRKLSISTLNASFSTQKIVPTARMPPSPPAEPSVPPPRHFTTYPLK